jgi:hypothetical protein
MSKRTPKCRFCGQRHKEVLRYVVPPDPLHPIGSIIEGPNGIKMLNVGVREYSCPARFDPRILKP